jgi:hypothetical protein
LAGEGGGGGAVPVVELPLLLGQLFGHKRRHTRSPDEQIAREKRRFAEQIRRGDRWWERDVNRPGQGWWVDYSSIDPEIRERLADERLAEAASLIQSSRRRSRAIGVGERRSAGFGGEYALDLAQSVTPVWQPGGPRPVYQAQQSGAPTGQARPPWPTTREEYAALAARFARQALEQWLRIRQSRASARALAHFRRQLLRLAQGRNMPYPNTSFFSQGGGGRWAGGDWGGSGGGDWLSGIGSLAGGIGSLVRSFSGQGSLEDAYDVPYFPDVLVPDVLQRGMATAGMCGSPFAPTRQGASASLFAMPNPATGRLTWFRPAGRPVLFSGDLATCKRVRKIAGHARRRLGGR